MFWFSLQLLSETFFILRRIQQEIIINVHRSLGKVLIILVRCESNLNFFDRFKKIIKFHEKLSSGSWVAPGGQTEMEELTAAFQNFVKTLKISQCTGTWYNSTMTVTGLLCHTAL
jgi:hypothetical protein